MNISLDKIIVGERQRVDLGDIDSLATSLNEIGLINALTVVPLPNDQWYLLAGRRRFEAAKKLGWKEIRCDNTVVAPTETQKQRIEFEEDIKRKDRTWQEKCLAVTKLNTLLKLDRNEQGESWTVREMASFTGMEKSNIAYMLQVGGALMAVPRDEEVWNCDCYTDAIKLLIARTEKVVRAELERRRELAKASIAASPVQVTDTTAPGEEPKKEQEDTTKVALRGTNMPFYKAVPDKDFYAGVFFCVLGYRPEVGCLPNIKAALRPDGFVILWFDSLSEWYNWQELAHDFALNVMPYPLLWNQVTLGQSSWPWCQNAKYGLVATPNALLPEAADAASCGVAAVPDDNNSLPIALVDFAIAKVVADNRPVLCINNAPVVAVAELGRIPVWYEENAIKFGEQIAALREHYERTVPGVVIV